MSFSSHKDDVELQLDKAKEFKQIYQFEDNFPQNNYLDLQDCLSRLAVVGTSISLDELVKLRKSLATIYAIVSFFHKDAEGEYPNLKRLAGNVSVHRDILVKIGSLLDANNVIRDNASENLLRIRQLITKKKGEVSRIMQRLMKSARTEGWAEKDSELSIRDGRLVIPVNTFYKRKLNGFIHDESATGKTSFVEPAEAFENNNEIQKLEFEEQREIQKILADFTIYLRPFIGDMEIAYAFLAEIDFLRANAKLAIELEATKPVIKDETVIRIFDGRHPLLVLAFARENKTVVPLKLILEDDSRILLISGPNAGGKSVCLKTIGLLQYMLQCGLLIPVSEFSHFGIFDKIFIDIGDEQSIENDLSTYSSHLMNMKHFVNYGDKKTLFLIDEFGTGTEPMLGGAIAESVLEELNKQKMFGVITTHYTNLKHYAGSTPGVVNGAMLFDSEMMRPLYSLNIGSPGSSFAFEIAKTIGLPKHLLDNAKSKIGQEHVDFDKNLQDVENEKLVLDKKRKEIEQKEARLQDNLLKYNAKLEKINNLKKDIIADANQQAKSILDTTNQKIENTIRTIKEAQAQKEATKKARAELDTFKEEFDKSKQDEIDKINRKIAKIKKKQDHIKNKQSKKQGTVQTSSKEQDEKIYLDEPIAVGDKVMMNGQTIPGEVIEINGKNTVVAFGNLRTTVKLDKLKKVSNSHYKKLSKSNKKIQTPTYDISKKRKSFNAQIDVRGMRADDALHEVHDFVEQGIVLDIKQLMILHGKGNGILRKLIRDYLRTVDMVRHYSDAHIEMGGDGITVIELE